MNVAEELREIRGKVLELAAEVEGIKRLFEEISV
jgi:hypothetical protein